MINLTIPFLDRRAVVPVKKARIGRPEARALDGTELPDLNNVQGDVYYGFPKNKAHARRRRNMSPILFSRTLSPS